MVLAMAVLLFHLPAATTLANAARGPISAKAETSNTEIAAPSAFALNRPAAERPSRASTFSSTARPAKLPMGLVPVPTSSSSLRVATLAANDATTMAKPSAAARGTNVPAAGQPPMTVDGSAPAGAIQPPMGSIAELTGPASSAIILPPPAFRPPFELPATHRRLWLALSTAEHSAATYDA